MIFDPETGINLQIDMSHQSVELITVGPIPILTLAQIMGLDFELPAKSSLDEDAYQTLIANYITNLWEQIYSHLITPINKIDFNSIFPESKNTTLVPKPSDIINNSSSEDEFDYHEQDYQSGSPEYVKSMSNSEHYRKWNESSSKYNSFNCDIDLIPINKKQASSIVSNLKIAEPSWRVPDRHQEHAHIQGKRTSQSVKVSDQHINLTETYIASPSPIVTNTNIEASTNISYQHINSSPSPIMTNQTISRPPPGFKPILPKKSNINSNSSTIASIPAPKDISTYKLETSKINHNHNLSHQIPFHNRLNPGIENDEPELTHIQQSTKNLIYKHPLSQERVKSPVTLTMSALIKKKTMESKRLVLEALSEMKATLSGRKVAVVAKQINNSYAPFAQYKSVHSIKDIENIIQKLAEDETISLNLSKERFAIEIPPNMPIPIPKFTKENLTSIITEMSHQLSNVICFDGAVKVLVNSYSKWASFDKQTKGEYATAAIYLLLKNKMLS